MKKQTFIVHINGKQNQSWQGEVEWVQGQKSQSFRSAMELLQLMDSAMDQEEEEDIRKY